MFQRLLPALAAVLLLSWATTTRADDPLVYLELGTEQGFPIGSHQRWEKYLRDFGFSGLRIRTGRVGDEPRIDTRGADAALRYYVFGILTANSRLELPGGSFRYGDRKQLTAWLAKLRSGGTEGVTSPTGAYGMTSRQLIALHDATKPTVTFSTKGRRAADVVAQLSRSIRIPVDIDASARMALAGQDQVMDELKGLSSGTALVVMVRPLGLVVVPGTSGRLAKLRITRSSGKEEVWPIGFKLPGAPANIAPSLFKWVNVEINQQPLEKAIEAVQSRVEVPILYDHNALAKHEIDMNTPVSFGPKRTFYHKILNELLFQAMLRSELKVDEDAHPFLWVTTVKK